MDTIASSILSSIIYLHISRHIKHPLIFLDSQQHTHYVGADLIYYIRRLSCGVQEYSWM